MSKGLPPILLASTLAYLLRGNPDSYVVFCQDNFGSELQVFEFNTLSSALDRFHSCTDQTNSNPQGGSSAIYQRSNNQYLLFSNYMQTRLGNFIDNVNSYIGWNGS